MHVHICSSEPCAQDLLKIMTACGCLIFCNRILSEHKSAAQMWDITLAGYTSQSAMETLLIITTGSGECSHDAEEVLSTWLKTAGMYMHLLASPDTVIATAACSKGAGCGRTCCDPSTMASAAMRPDLAAK